MHTFSTRERLYFPIQFVCICLKAFQLPFILSTSQTPITFIEQYHKDKTQMMGGFGTVTDEGYGVSYFINNDEFGELVNL